MRVSVFGLGYVGAVTCGCLARDGHEVIGVDVAEDKTALINRGQSPIIEGAIGDIIGEAVQAGRLCATTDVDAAIEGSDVSLISVGTPSADNGSLDVGAVARVCEQIGRAIAARSGRHLIVMRSTVLPGTCRDVVIPALERSSGKRAGEGFAVCFNPEFLREGSAIEDYDHPPFTLIGCDDPADGELAAKLYASVDAPVNLSSLETAEMVKYACNAFHALKITFANEMGIAAHALGVDGHRVMELLCRDTKLNISPKYLVPGFAFGGSCLPKDVRALLYRTRRSDVALPMMEAVLESNERQIERAVKRIVSLKKKRVAMLGLSFKAGTDDLRESPLVAITEALLGKGFDIRIYDRNISLARVVGANRTYITRQIPHIADLLVPDLETAVAHGEVLVIGNAFPEVEELARLCQPDQTVVDLVRVRALEGAASAYSGIVW